MSHIETTKIRVCHIAKYIIVLFTSCNISSESVEFVVEKFGFHNVMPKESQLEFLAMYFEAKGKYSTQQFQVTPEKLEEAYWQCSIASLVGLELIKICRF